ncbi:MAG: hypothetical protein V3W41_09015 [Planctomycetota bacterium]
MTTSPTNYDLSQVLELGSLKTTDGLRTLHALRKNIQDLAAVMDHELIECGDRNDDMRTIEIFATEFKMSIDLAIAAHADKETTVCGQP